MNQQPTQKNIVMKSKIFLLVMLFIAFGVGNAKAQTKNKTETIELKTANPDIVVKVIRDGNILETKAFNNSSSKSFELDYSVKITLKSKTKTFTKTLKNGATAMLPLKPNDRTFNKSELLSSADDELKYIDGTQIKAPQDQSLYNSLISAELASFTAKEVK